MLLQVHIGVFGTPKSIHIIVLGGGFERLLTVDNMGVDLATYRARIGTFISRRNVCCDDERRRTVSAKQTWRRRVSEMSSTGDLKCMDVKIPYCSHSLDLYIYNTIGLGSLQPNLPHVRPSGNNEPHVFKQVLFFPSRVCIMQVICGLGLNGLHWR